MSKWQSKNLPKASFNVFFAVLTTAQIAEFLPNNIALLNKQL